MGKVLLDCDIIDIDKFAYDLNKGYDTLDSINKRKYPSKASIRELILLCKKILFPNYFGKIEDNISSKGYIKEKISKLVSLLYRQLDLVLYDSDNDLSECIHNIVSGFVSELSSIRFILFSDLKAIVKGDPATDDYSEVILCYPGFDAILCYRIAHALASLKIPLIPRQITELSHSCTGIDIHPLAQIGHHFSIDHGTGIVIGSTAIIGNNVRLYQGVTLGAKSFKEDTHGNVIVESSRHPILEDDVTIYSGATILGNVTIGKNSIIGGNVWITSDVPSSSIVKQCCPTRQLDISVR